MLKAPQSEISFSPSQNGRALKHIVRVSSEISVESAYEQEQIFNSFASLDQALSIIEFGLQTPDAVFINTDLSIDGLMQLKDQCRQKAIPLIFYTKKYEEASKDIALTLGADDYYFGTLTTGFLKRLEFIKKLKEYKNERAKNPHTTKEANDVPVMKVWSNKRIFDIILSGSALLFLSPIMLILAVIIKLDSKGPVFYISKRAGTGYKIFDFYKFRTMRVGADSEIKKLLHRNQYSVDQGGVFFKIKDDPRVTKLGAFLRMTSLDEIPQLINVVKGDMSLVGNRPLPLYEAEQLTKDQIAWRFLAPAGITGMWQISKRGKDNMSQEERIQLDMEYAMTNSFWLDLKIIISTIPAMLQKEKV